MRATIGVSTPTALMEQWPKQLVLAVVMVREPSLIPLQVPTESGCSLRVTIRHFRNSAPSRRRTRNGVPPVASQQAAVNPAHNGAETVNQVGDLVRREFYRRIDLADLLAPATSA